MSSLQVGAGTMTHLIFDRYSIRVWSMDRHWIGFVECDLHPVELLPLGEGMVKVLS
jgi:hypothetical protein